MRIIFFLVIIGFCFVSAKYLRYEPSDTNILLRNKRSNSEESVASIDDNDEDEKNDSDDDSIEKILSEFEIKQKEKEEKQKHKLEEKQRKLEEKQAKEQRKQEEKREKEERKRQEKLEKEKLKEEETRQKLLEKIEKEIKKQEKKQLKEIEKIKKELNDDSDSDEFLNTEEESSIELGDLWRHHIYVKYGLTLISTQLEKQAALERYLEEELGLNSNSTETERNEAIVKLIQNKLQKDAKSRDVIKNQLLSHVNDISIQKIKNKLEKDLEKLNNKSAILSNVNLTWASKAKQQIEGKRTLLQTIAEFLSSLIPNWFPGSKPQEVFPVISVTDPNIVNYNVNNDSDANTNQSQTIESNLETDLNNPDNNVNNNIGSEIETKPVGQIEPDNSVSGSNGNINEEAVSGVDVPNNVNNPVVEAGSIDSVPSSSSSVDTNDQPINVTNVNIAEDNVNNNGGSESAANPESLVPSSTVNASDGAVIDIIVSTNVNKPVGVTEPDNSVSGSNGNINGEAASGVDVPNNVNNPVVEAGSIDSVPSSSSSVDTNEQPINVANVNIAEDNVNNNGGSESAANPESLVPNSTVNASDGAVINIIASTNVNKPVGVTEPDKSVSVSNGIINEEAASGVHVPNNVNNPVVEAGSINSVPSSSSSVDTNEQPINVANVSIADENVNNNGGAESAANPESLVPSSTVNASDGAVIDIIVSTNVNKPVGVTEPDNSVSGSNGNINEEAASGVDVPNNVNNPVVEAGSIDSVPSSSSSVDTNEQPINVANVNIAEDNVNNNGGSESAANPESLVPNSTVNASDGAVINIIASTNVNKPVGVTESDNSVSVSNGIINEEAASGVHVPNNVNNPVVEAGSINSVPSSSSSVDTNEQPINVANVSIADENVNNNGGAESAANPESLVPSSAVNASEGAVIDIIASTNVNKPVGETEPDNSISGSNGNINEEAVSGVDVPNNVNNPVVEAGSIDSVTSSSSIVNTNEQPINVANVSIADDNVNNNGGSESAANPESLVPSSTVNASEGAVIDIIASINVNKPVGETEPDNSVSSSNGNINEEAVSGVDVPNNVNNPVVEAGSIDSVPSSSSSVNTNEQPINVANVSIADDNVNNNGGSESAANPESLVPNSTVNASEGAVIDIIASINANKPVGEIEPDFSVSGTNGNTNEDSVIGANVANNVNNPAADGGSVNSVSSSSSNVNTNEQPINVSNVETNVNIPENNINNNGINANEVSVTDLNVLQDFNKPLGEIEPANSTSASNAAPGDLNTNVLIPSIVENVLAINDGISSLLNSNTNGNDAINIVLTDSPIPESNNDSSVTISDSEIGLISGGGDLTTENTMVIAEVSPVIAALSPNFDKNNLSETSTDTVVSVGETSETAAANLIKEENTVPQGTASNQPSGVVDNKVNNEPHIIGNAIQNSDQVSIQNIQDAQEVNTPVPTAAPELNGITLLDEIGATVMEIFQK